VNIQLEASGIKKVFNRRVIFRNISFSLRERNTLLITGRNGSGKSTLIKIISSVLSPTAGSIRIVSNDMPARPQAYAQLTGLVSPYLQMYDEFSAREMLSLALAIRGMRASGTIIVDLLRRVSLEDRCDDPVRTYSSGMKQRVKYAFALIHRPPVLLLDEPMANLDAEGVAIVQDIMEEQRREGILIVATNDLRDIRTYDLQIDLNAIH